MSKIRVIMCDDQQYMCECFEYALRATGDIEFLGYATNKKDAKKLIESVMADIILLDIQMDTATTGLELIPVVQENQPQAKIIMMTVHEDEEYIFRAFSEGVSDYFLKTYSNDELINSIRMVYNNQVVLRPFVAQKILDESRRIAEKQKEIEENNRSIQESQKSLLYVLNIMTKLSTAEFEILKELYYGKSCVQIADERYVSESTIRTHTGRILKKFECSSMKKLISELKKMDAFSMFE